MRRIQQLLKTRIIRWGGIVLAFFLLLYVTSYVILSRRGYARTDEAGLGNRTFFFVIPDTPKKCQQNVRWERMYAPLIKLDVLLGTGRKIFNGDLCTGLGK